MTKLERLRSALEGTTLGPGDEALMADLAQHLASNRIDQVASLLRRARRTGRDDERSLRASRREGRTRDADQMGRDAERTLRRSLGRRAATDLEALAALHEHYRQEHEVLSLAVEGLRQDHSDTEIGMALGYVRDYARQEVRRRFGPRGDQYSPENGD